MKIHSTYSIKLHMDANGKAFAETTRLYRAAVDFYIHVCEEQWERYASVSNQKMAVNLSEQLTVRTKRRPEVLCGESGQAFITF